MSNKSIKMVAALAAMVMVLSVLVTSCGPTPAPEVIKETVVVEKEVVVTATPEPKEAGPVSGGHLMFGFETTIEDTGDMALSGSSHSAFLVGNMVDTTIRMDPDDGTLHPGLAESWEIADDEQSITLNLRKDVTFHDGTPFNAEAVKYNLERIATLPEAAGGWAYTELGVSDYFDKVEVVDEYTAKISYKQVYALMLNSLTMNIAGSMHSPTAIEKWGADYGTEEVVGTGPFKWVEWTGSYGELTCERNEDYNWASPIYSHQGPTYLDGFTFKGINEATTRSAAVEAGSLDVAWIAEKDVVHFEEMAGFKTVDLRAKGFGAIRLNTAHPTLADARVRQAISHAIDREAILNSSRWDGIGEMGLAYMGERLWGQSLEEFRPYNYWYDLDKAKALLEEVGWKDEDGDGVREAYGVEGVADGTPLHLLYPSGSGPGLAEAEMVQAMLAKAGIELEIQMLDWDARQQAKLEGKFDLAYNDSDSSSILCVFPEFQTGTQANIGKYSNSRFDELAEIAFGTTDPDKQREAAAEAMEIILQDAVDLTMIRRTFPYATREGVEGLTTDALGVGVYLYDTWINPNP